MSSVPTVQVVPAGPAHSQGVWDIRYHPAINESVAARNKNVVPFEQHDAWFKKKYCTGELDRCYVLEIDGSTQGYCRFDLNEQGEFVVSLVLHPTAQGRGWGSMLLREALRLADVQRTLVACVHLDNGRSMALFMKNGFVRTGEIDDEVILKKFFN